MLLLLLLCKWCVLCCRLFDVGGVSVMAFNAAKLSAGVWMVFDVKLLVDDDSAWCWDCWLLANDVVIDLSGLAGSR